MIWRIVKNLIYNIKQTLLWSFINYAKKTRVYSCRASLKAIYGENVGIGYDTYVSQDVRIGYASYVNEKSWVEGCIIGNYCSISDHVMIGPTEHYLHKIISHPIIGVKPRRLIVIGNDVLISHGATILQGVHIGDGAVIAAGAVVTKDIPPYEIWGGVPARYIKKRFDNETIDAIRDNEIYSLKISDVQHIILKNERHT